MTTLTTDQTSVARPTTASTVRVLLVGAPLLMAVGRALLVPLDDQEWDKVLTSMAKHETRSDIGWLLALAACGLLAIATVVLARRLTATGRTRSAWFVAITTSVGWASTAGLCGSALLMSTMASAPDRAAQVQVLKDFNASAVTGVAFLFVLAAAVGYVVLAVSLVRARLATRGAAVLIGLGGATTLVTMAGPVTVLLVLTALLLAAGHALATASGRGTTSDLEGTA